MAVCCAILCLGAVMLAWYLSEKVKSCSLKATFLKSIVSLLFLTLAVWSWYARGGKPEKLGIFVILGLLCGLLGDIWLDLKYVFPAQDTPFTYAGFLAFGIGHVLYVAGMAVQFGPRGEEAYILVPILLGVACGFLTTALEKPMKLCYGKLKPIATAYGATLFSTVLVAGSLALRYDWHETALNLLFAGGALFAISDLVLSGTYFGEGRDRPVDLILNYLTYYPAQFLIAFSLYFLR
ncbi:MAG: hypothetical protein E7422_02125 [Ruminococcaceae bacterium]|jgi:hypothetical protein|nr:hypothetical protein [Oscillospiraceae bacterium]